MKKKTGAMFLTICMLLGMLSGCGSKQPSAQASTSAKENLTSSAPAEETPGPAGYSAGARDLCVRGGDCIGSGAGVYPRILSPL